jgi:DNA-binding transcriptional ArsR family regulator
MLKKQEAANLRGKLDDALKSLEEAKNALENGPRYVEAAELGYGILIAGSGVVEAEALINGCNIGLPAHNDLYDAINRVCNEISTMARTSCQEARKNLCPGDAISFDGAYDHRRRAGRCFVCVCCQRTGEILAYTVVSNKIAKELPNFCQIPQNMEVHAMKLLIEELKDSDGKFRSEISGYVHDNDAKTRNLIKRLNWNIVEYLDPGHAMKSFDRVMLQYPMLKEIQLSLRKFMGHLLHSNKLNQVERANAWMNAVNHYSGDHSNCPFEHLGREGHMQWTRIDENGNREALISFLNKTKWIAERCVNEFSTQVNESINRSRIKWARKDVRWGNSYDARMGCAVLDRNYPFWKLALRERLGLREFDPLPKIQHLHMERNRLARKAKASTVSQSVHEAVLRREKQCFTTNLATERTLGLRAPPLPSQLNQNPNIDTQKAESPRIYRTCRE